VHGGQRSEGKGFIVNPKSVFDKRNISQNCVVKNRLRKNPETKTLTGTILQHLLRFRVSAR
jgi:hypothetical protein